MRQLVILAWFLFGCGSSSSGPAGGAADASAPEAGSGGGDSGRGAGATTCFAPTGASEAECESACAPLASCDLGFGKCSDVCGLGGPTFDRTIRCTMQANGDCAAFRRCVDCTAVCTQAKNCSPPQSEGDCCAGCLQAVACEDPNALACDAIASCAAAGR